MNRGLSVLIALMLSAPSVTLIGDSARVFHSHELQSNVASVIRLANGKGHASTVLAGYGNVRLTISVLTRSGGAEIHPHLDDLMIVQKGSATLVTGGTLTQREDLPNGGVKGTGIQNGVSQQIGVGDIVLIPAGVPHQLLIAPGTVYASLVAKVKEP